uniref:Uncharacterized protein n=1 Tax=Vitis vinifera TaxID=29760 RepID=A5B9G8_VITVI|nr:hypothetical protein VITISV_032437 [Vitis vinifera]
MSKRKGKKMKSSSSIEEFWAEFNIPMSIGLGFLEEKDVNLVESSLVEDELFLPMGYFEAGLRLPLPLLFRDLARHLQLTLNQFYVNIIRLIISMVVLDHIKGLHISTRDVMYIYHAKRSCILYEWYLFPQSGMGGFIIGGLSTNKEVNREIIVVSGHWEFGASKPEELLRASWVHGILSNSQSIESSTAGAFLAHNIPGKSRSGGYVTRSCIGTLAGKDLLPTIHAFKQLSSPEDIRALPNISYLVIMDKSIGLSNQGLGLDDSFGLVKETKVPSNVSGGDKQVPMKVLEVGKVVTNLGVPYKDIGDSSKSAVRPSL